LVLEYSCNNTVINNELLSDNDGISIFSHSSFNLVSKNTISNNNDDGISLGETSNSNTIVGNGITKNNNGIYLWASSNNTICHNDFVNNTRQVYVDGGLADSWDNGVEGNYWSNYTGVDSDYDGIGDTWYEIDSSNIDHYPLMGMFSDFDATSERSVQTICNSSISGFQYGDSSIRFNVTGEDGTAGFCRICIPTALMNATYRVFVNGTEVQCNLLPCSNSTHSYLYFTYSHSTKEIVIIPELASLIILPLFMLATLIVVIICNKKRIDIT
jgi:parallel beta-helix repeat protein